MVVSGVFGPRKLVSDDALGEDKLEWYPDIKVEYAVSAKA